MNEIISFLYKYRDLSNLISASSYRAIDFHIGVLSSLHYHLFMKNLSIKNVFTILFFYFSIASSFSSTSIEEGHFVFDPDRQLIHLFKAQKLVVDHISESGYELYGPKGLSIFLDNLKADYQELDEQQYDHHDNKGLTANYPTPKEIESKLKNLAKNNPDILKLISIGKSKNGNDLWVMKISDNPTQDELEPEFKYIANMHGNEIVGRDIMILFIEDLIKSYRNNNKSVRFAIDNTEIFIMPSMNPDGALKRRRGNGNNRDLNRDFPDFTTRDNTNTDQGRQPETVAVMKWQKRRNFSLSANFHGGAKCVNYPWDTSADAAPLTPLIKKFSLLYASTVPGMYNSTRFENGIVNGYDWYEVNGGMQDWSYHWHNDLQVTIELSNVKWPDYTRIPSYYQDNKKSLLAYLLKVHQGAGLRFRSKQAKGTVEIKSLAINKTVGIYGFEKGEFYKVLPPGSYKFIVTLDNGMKKTFNREVTLQPMRRGKFNLF